MPAKKDLPKAIEHRQEVAPAIQPESPSYSAKKPSNEKVGCIESFSRSANGPNDAEGQIYDQEIEDEWLDFEYEREMQNQKKIEDEWQLDFEYEREIRDQDEAEEEQAIQDWEHLYWKYLWENSDEPFDTEGLNFEVDEIGERYVEYFDEDKSWVIKNRYNKGGMIS